MKKFLFSVLACGLVATGMTSCQNEADEPVINTVSNIESTFPEGSKIANVTLNLPKDARTRGFESPVQQMPLWYLSGQQIDTVQQIHIRYGVYRSDGTLYYESESKETEPLLCNPSGITIKMPMPANDAEAKIFIWADQFGAESKVHYPIDWANKTVKISGAQGLLNQDMSKYADAFCYWGKPKSDTQSGTVALRRPFVQVNLLSDEFNLPAINALYQYGIHTRLHLVDEAGNAKIPEKWNWETDQIWFAASLGCNQVVNPRGYTTRLPYGTITNYPTVKIGDRNFEYMGLFYFFAPQTRGAWIDATDGKKYANFKFDIKPIGDNMRPVGSSSAGYFSLTSSQLPDFKANDQIVIYNQNKPEDGGGILTESNDVKLRTTTIFNTASDTPDVSSMTFTKTKK